MFSVKLIIGLVVPVAPEKELLWVYGIDEVYCDLKDLILVEFPDLESSGDIVTDTNLVITDKNVVQQQTTVGNLCSYASSNFENVAMLKDKEYGNDEYLASNVFKIENYTPFKKRLPR